MASERETGREKKKERRKNWVVHREIFQRGLTRISSDSSAWQCERTDWSAVCGSPSGMAIERVLERQRSASRERPATKSVGSAEDDRALSGTSTLFHAEWSSVEGSPGHFSHWRGWRGCDGAIGACSSVSESYAFDRVMILLWSLLSHLSLLSMFDSRLDLQSSLGMTSNCEHCIAYSATSFNTTPRLNPTPLFLPLILCHTLSCNRAEGGGHRAAAGRPRTKECLKYSVVTIPANRLASLVAFEPDPSFNPKQTVSLLPPRLLAHG
jgi:hypothetical protein